MRVDPNRRESSLINRRSMTGQDRHKNMCSSWERVRAAMAGCVSSTSANSVFVNGKLPDPKGNPYQA